MPEVVDCPNSLVAFFPPAVYHTVGSHMVLPELLQSVSREQLSTAQFLRNGAVRLTFKTAASCDAVVAGGITVHGHVLRVVSVETKSRLIHLRDCPAEVPDSKISGFFGPFGEVHSISHSEHIGFPGLRDGTRVVKMTLTKDVPPVVRVAGFDCRVWYRRQPAYCTICKKSGHRGKGCPLDGLCRRCERPGHVAKECRNAWASRSTVRRPAAPAAPAPAAAPDAAVTTPPVAVPAPDAVPVAAVGTPSVATAAPVPDVAPVAAAGSSDIPPAPETAMAVSEDEEDESDLDFLPGNDEEAYVSACSSAEFASGDDEVVAAPPVPPSPKRQRRKRKRRGQGPPRPAPGPPAPEPAPGPSTMDLSSEDPSDARLIHTFREVWEDTLTWEEIRARKVDMSGFDPSQAQPTKTLVLFYETPLPISSSTPVPLDSPVPPTIPSVGSTVTPVATTPVPDCLRRSPFAIHITLNGAPEVNGIFDYGDCTEKIMNGISIERVRVHDYEDQPELRPAIVVPTAPLVVLPDVPPARFPAPPDVPQ